jgi:hypothetical protein
MFKEIEFKFPGMRKPASWTVYPAQEGRDTVIVQSETRIAELRRDGSGMLSVAKKGGAGFAHLSKWLGASPVSLSASEVAPFFAAQKAMGKEPVRIA